VDFLESGFLGDWGCRVFVERTKVPRNVKLFLNVQFLVSEDCRKVSTAEYKYKHPTNTRLLSLQPGEHYRNPVSSVSGEHCGVNEQLIFLGRGKLPQVDSCDFRSDNWCKVLNLLRGTEQRFLLWISRVTTVSDVDFLERFPTDDGEVWLQYIFVFDVKPGMISLTL